MGPVSPAEMHIYIPLLHGQETEAEVPAEELV